MTTSADLPAPAELTPPRWQPRTRMAGVIGTVIACSATFGVGAIAGRGTSTLSGAIFVPVHVDSVKPIAAAEESDAEVTGEEIIPPRATVPHLFTECLVPRDDDALDELCAWEDGFPAISGDGKLIAIKHAPDDELSIRFLDSATGRVVRDALIGSADAAPAPAARLLAQRAAGVQRMLDARRFRSLVPLAERTDDEAEPRAEVYIETHGSLVRMIDAVANTVIGVHRFAAQLPAGSADDGCDGTRVVDVSVWWDPATRVVLGESTFATGGCICPERTVPRVYKMP